MAKSNASASMKARVVDCRIKKRNIGTRSGEALFGSKFPAKICHELPGFRNNARRSAMRSPKSQADDDKTSAERARFGHNCIIDVVNADVLIGRIGKHRAAAVSEGNRGDVAGIETDRRVGCAGTSAEIDGADLSS